MPNRLVTYTGVMLIVLVVLAAAEIAAYFASTYIAMRYGIVFYLPHITESYATYAARVNPLLGWPSPQALQEQLQQIAGTTTVPASGSGKSPDRRIAISAYGDSFTAGFGVEPEDVWSNRLSNMLGCRIVNYGVPGYGTDQSYLRFHHNPQDEAKIVLFGQLSENIQRNVNQLRNFLVPNPQCQTKPRFVLDEQGQLQFVPIPKLSAEEYHTFTKNPEGFLKNDFFLPGGPSGAQKLGFPYLLSSLKSYKFFYYRYIFGYKSYLQFYQSDHPSGAFPLLMAIFHKFIQEAKERGKHPVILIFPTDEDFRVYKRNQQFIYVPLVNEFKKNNIEHIDLGSELLKRLGDRDYMEIFSGERYFHFNREGNRLVAQIIYDYFISKNYWPRAPQQTSTPRGSPMPPGGAPL